MTSSKKKILEDTPPSPLDLHSSGKRLSRSIEPRHSNTRANEVQKSSPQLIFQCKSCHAILANNSLLLKVLRFHEKFFCFSTREPKILIDDSEILMSAEGEYDQFCVYNTLHCQSCEFELGKYYISFTEKLDDSKGLYVIPESNLVIYDIETSKVLMTPKPKIPEARHTETTSSKGRTIDITDKKSLSSNKKDRSTNETPKRNLNMSFTEHEQKTPDVKHIKQLNEKFNELKSILSGFAQLLQQFDLRLSSSERTTALINETLTHMYNETSDQKELENSQ